MAVPGSGVGQERYQLYRNANSRIKQASSQGSHLVMWNSSADRLEGRLSFLTKSDFSLETLGALNEKWREIETDGTPLALVVKDLDGWRVQRN